MLARNIQINRERVFARRFAGRYSGDAFPVQFDARRLHRLHLYPDSVPDNAAVNPALVIGDNVEDDEHNGDDDERPPSHKEKRQYSQRQPYKEDGHAHPRKPVAHLL